MGIKMYNKQVCQKPPEKLLFSLLSYPTLNANFKWKPLKVAALILIWK